MKKRQTKSRSRPTTFTARDRMMLLAVLNRLDKLILILRKKSTK